jgi:cell division protein FtsI/penicillin-binding protein 2
LFSAKILFLSYNDLPEQKIIKKKENFRSSIIDREGDILAKSVRITNLGIDPKLVVDKKKLLIIRLKKALSAHAQEVSTL